MSTTDYTAKALADIRTADAERRLEHRRRQAERRATEPRPVAPSRAGFAAVLFHVFHDHRTAAAR